MNRDLTERIDRMHELARKHEGRYLLPRRFYKPNPFDRSDTDLDYDAAAELVNRGEARWLRNSKFAPGIQFLRLDWSDAA